MPFQPSAGSGPAVALLPRAPVDASGPEWAGLRRLERAEGPALGRQASLCLALPAAGAVD